MEAAPYGQVGMASLCDLPETPESATVSPEEKLCMVPSLTVNPVKTPKSNLWLCLPQRNRPKKGIYTWRQSSPCIRGKKLKKKWSLSLFHKLVSFKRKCPSVSYYLFSSGYVLGQFLLLFFFFLQTTTKRLQMTINKNQYDLIIFSQVSISEISIIRVFRCLGQVCYFNIKQEKKRIKIFLIIS